MEYHINERDELITLTATEDVTSADARACIGSLLADKLFDPQLPQLIDLRTAMPRGTCEELDEFEALIRKDYQPQLAAHVAIVVNPDWEETVCAKAFLFSCALDQAELFDGWNQACKWLINKEFDTNFADLNAIEPCQEFEEDVAIGSTGSQPDSAPAESDSITPPG